VLCIVSVCSLTYSACDAHASYLWPVWLYHIFPHYLINDTIFGGRGEVIEHKLRVLIWIDLAQDRDRWWALVNAVMKNFGFHKMRGIS